MTAGAIVISGAGGLIGSALIESLGDRPVLRLSRKSGAGSVHWDPTEASFDAAPLDGCDAVVHLAGEPIAASRWRPAVKDRIRTSRVEGTRMLVRGLRGLTRPPRALICASAIGYYGDRGEELLTESSPAGSDFLAEACREWEESAGFAREAGIRVVSLRIGIVLSAQGGALAKMLTPFRLGAGGRLGHGRQWMSWIHIEDLVRAIGHTMKDESLSGPVNAVSPEPVRNAEFTRALARVLRRPALFPAPALALRLALGEMADALLLSSQRVVPSLLTGRGFSWKHRDLGKALGHLLA